MKGVSFPQEEEARPEEGDSVKKKHEEEGVGEEVETEEEDTRYLYDPTGHTE